MCIGMTKMGFDFVKILIHDLCCSENVSEISL